jgi:predicted CopG family antitoxin
MVKTIHLHIEEELYNKLIKMKGTKTWVEFLEKLVET